MQKWRFTPICVRDCFLPNFKLLLPKNAFNYKLVQGMQDAPENCVWIQFVLKTSTRNTTRSWKLCFTLACVGKWLLLNFTPLLPKNAFNHKLAQGMQDAPENCVLIQFVLKTSTRTTTRTWKLCFTLICVGKWLLLNFTPLLPKNAFSYELSQMSDAPENCVLIQFVLRSGFCKSS